VEHALILPEYQRRSKKKFYVIGYWSNKKRLYNWIMKEND